MLEFAGINPCVVLYGADGDVVSAASYWHADYSLRGPGKALFLIRKAGETLSATIFASDVDTAAFFAGFNQHFGGFEDVDLDVAVELAEFRTEQESDRYLLEVTSGQTRVEVEWRQPEAPSVNRSIVSEFGNDPQRNYEVTSTVIPVAEGSITVDGSVLDGAIIENYGDLPRSAFLAFSETWVRI